jgi:hypothetical protein
MPITWTRAYPGTLGRSASARHTRGLLLAVSHATFVARDMNTVKSAMALHGSGVSQTPAGDRRPLLRHGADRTVARSGAPRRPGLITDSDADPPSRYADRRIGSPHEFRRHASRSAQIARVCVGCDEQAPSCQYRRVHQAHVVMNRAVLQPGGTYRRRSMPISARRARRRGLSAVRSRRRDRHLRPADPASSSQRPARCNRSCSAWLLAKAATG